MPGGTPGPTTEGAGDSNLFPSMHIQLQKCRHEGHDQVQLSFLGAYNMISVRIFLLVCSVVTTSGCVLTKVVTVPMRLGAAVISIVPGVGNTAHDVIDKAAEEVDDVPI